MTGRPTKSIRRIPHYVMMVIMAVTLAACATPPQQRSQISIVEMMAEQPQRPSGLACASDAEALVCESTGLRSRRDRKCTCVNRRAFVDPRLF